jgi:putative ABC transport system permease protein
MRLVAIGIVIGGVFGTLVAVAMAKFVVGVRAFDPVALGSVALLLAGATLLACWLPARRAAKVDPMVALRTE